MIQIKSWYVERLLVLFLSPHPPVGGCFSISPSPAKKISGHFICLELEIASFNFLSVPQDMFGRQQVY